ALLVGGSSNITFFFLVLGIYYIMSNVLSIQHTADCFGHVYTCCTHENRLTTFMVSVYFLNYGVLLLPCGSNNYVLFIIPDDLLIRRNNDHLQIVNLTELPFLGSGCTRHT